MSFSLGFIPTFPAAKQQPSGWGLCTGQPHPCFPFGVQTRRIKACSLVPGPPSPVQAWVYMHGQHSWNPDGIPGAQAASRRLPHRLPHALLLGKSPLPPLIMRNFCSQALPLRYSSMVSWGLQVPVRGTQRPVIGDPKRASQTCAELPIVLQPICRYSLHSLGRGESEACS